MTTLSPATESFPASTSTKEETRRWAVAIGAAIVVLVTFGFFLLFFNRFAGIRTANGSGLVGSQILNGGIPYRDWFSPVPPLFQIESALWTWLFGPALIVQRIVGVCLRAVLGVVLYLWLARLFRPSSAALGAIVAIVVSAGDRVDPILSYHHDAILWAVAAGLFASICLDWRSNRKASLASFLCGVTAGLSICDLQSIGLGITVAVPVLVALSLWRTTGFRLAGRFAAWFCTGWLVPIAALSYWLYSHGALGLFLHDVLFRGPSAKAGAPTDFIVRWLLVTFAAPSLRWSFIVAAILLIFVIKPLFYPIRMPAGSGRNSRALFFVAALSAVSIGGAAGAAYAGLAPWEVIVRASAYFTLLGCGMLAVLFSLDFLLGKMSDLQRQFWLLGTVGFVCSFMLSLSWPTWSAMAIPGLGFLAAGFVDLPSRRARAVGYLASAILLFSLTVWKLWYPSAFNDWSEPPVMAANTTPSLPALWGLRLPKPEVTMIEGAAQIIREHSTAQDKIFTYPMMPIFYAVSHRGWPGFAFNHNIDFCPDNIARGDAADVLRAKPAVIIFYRQDPEFLRGQEALWRHGQKCGQRAIIAAIEELVKHYKLAASYPAPTTKLTVDVYVRQ